MRIRDAVCVQLRRELTQGKSERSHAADGCGMAGSVYDLLRGEAQSPT